MSRFRPAAVLALVLAAPAFAGPYDNLLTTIPPDANTLVLVDVKAAYASPLARAEKWADDNRTRYKSGTGFVPPDAERVVVASLVNFSSLTRDHQIGLVKVSGLPTINQLATREAGSLSSIAGQSYVLSPRDVYYTTLAGPAAIAAVYPADRQVTARWTRYALKSKTVDVAPYLKQAAADAEGNILTVALDLADTQDPATLKIGLATSAAIARAKITEVDRVARYVATIRGLTFNVQGGSSLTATVRVDFGDDPTPHRKVLGDLFKELVEDQGVAIDGLDKWDVSFGPTSMQLTGPLTTKDLRRVLSLFAFPGAGNDDAKLSPGEVTQAATQRYWGALNALLADLRVQKDTPDVYLKTATWYEKTAAQIDHLSRKGVDQLAVDVGHECGRRIRAIGASMRGVPIDVNAIDQKSYYFYQPTGGYGGWWGVRGAIFAPKQLDTNIPQVQGEMARVIANDQKKRIDTWAQIDQMLSDARNKLSDKYKSGF